MNKGGTEDEPGIRKAAQDGNSVCSVTYNYNIFNFTVHAALESIEESGIPSNRILLGMIVPLIHQLINSFIH